MDKVEKGLLSYKKELNMKFIEFSGIQIIIIFSFTFILFWISINPYD